jgi:DNA invertase Pin-like site-specific DNA recombinase
MNAKISPVHLERFAVVYVRQSSPQQVRHHHEGRRLQYAMKNELVALGWPEARIEIIDADLGVTASGAARRQGFDRLLSQVTLGHVGIIAAREVTRFARNSSDWQKLLEICRQVNTILVDHETVYDLRNANDRLLIGIKGNISGYELDLLRARALDARESMARRGEYVCRVPVGYVKTHDRRIEMTPDMRVREAIALVFAKFLELGSAVRVARWFEGSGLEVPAEAPGCRDGTQVRWVPLRINRAINFLRNPAYAGVYAYGRSRATRVATENGMREQWKRSHDPAQWKYVHKEHHEGYIDFDTFEKIRGMLDGNRQSFVAMRGAGGAAKNGTGLLGGLIRCGGCGRLMHVGYRTRDKTVTYRCHAGIGDDGEACSFQFSGTQPETLVVRAALQALEPLAVAAAERAFETEHAAVDDRERALERECEQARYEAGRAQRQYDAIEPENRLVAATLERRWNEALARVAGAEARLAEHRGRERRSKRGHADFMAMAKSFPEVWNAPDADVSLKKRILRTLIEEVSADTAADGREVCLRVHWKGGTHTEHRYRRRPGGRGNVYPDDTVKVITELSVMCDDSMTAKYLNEHGIPRPNGAPWNRDVVCAARKARGIKRYDPARRQAEGLLTLNEAAKFIGISHDALAALAARGEVPHVHPLPYGPYIFRRSELEGQNGERLRFAVRARTKRKGAKSLENGGLFD